MRSASVVILHNLIAHALAKGSIDILADKLVDKLIFAFATTSIDLPHPAILAQQEVPGFWKKFAKDVQREGGLSLPESESDSELAPEPEPEPAADMEAADAAERNRVTASEPSGSSSGYVPPSLRIKKVETVSSSSEKVEKVEDPGGSLIIRNFPPEATDEDLVELCNPLGNLKFSRVRVSKSGDAYALARFWTKGDAEKALQQLNGYQYGYHVLTVEWSKNYEEMAAERKAQEIQRKYHSSRIVSGGSR